MVFNGRNHKITNYFEVFELGSSTKATYEIIGAG